MENPVLSSRDLTGSRFRSLVSPVFGSNKLLPRLPLGVQDTGAKHIFEGAAFSRTVMQLTAKDQQRLTTLESIVREQEFGMLRWAKALWEIKISGLWKSTGESWPDYCQETFGYSRTKAYEWISAIEFVENQKLIAQTTGETFTEPSGIKEAIRQKRVRPADAKILQVTENKPTLSKPVSAKLVPDGQIEYSKPPPMPLTFRQEVSELVRILDGLLMGEGGFALSQKFRHAVAIAKHIQQEVQAELPGMAEQFPKFKRPTSQQVIEYAATISISASDAEGFFDLKNGIGWKDVKDWQSTLRSWKKYGYLASQKQAAKNGHPTGKTLAQQDIERMKAKVERL